MLTAGTNLGSYEILAPLGAGGMGEVYRARDTRLGREVAVKVLPQELAASRDRLRRFEQEARAASALNHPNILAIYDVGTFEQAPFVVMELLDGETLRQRLATSALLPRKAVDYALQIARGLAAAHEMGIIHRDLKPENIFVTRDGRVKILDFGLAKLTAPRIGRGETTDEPTVPIRTESGMVLGTVGYMSPEQVRGEEADHRSDIFSFGAILYEMLSGRRAFRGDSAVETMSAILKEEPPELVETGRALPLGLERVVRHCLEKRREERFHSASDLAFALEAISGLSSSGAVAPMPLSTRSRALPWLVRAAALALVALAGFLAGRARSTSTPSFHRLTYRRGWISSARFAPDAQTIVYGAAWEGKPSELYSARADSPESRAFGFGTGDIQSISSSGEMALLLGEEEGFTLARAPLAGGAPREILEKVTWADWSPDGKTLAVVRHLPAGDKLEYPIGKTLHQSSGWITHPRVSPDGSGVAFLDHPLSGDDKGSVVFVETSGGKRTISGDWRSIWGLAWARNPREVWFTATRSGARALYAARPGGRERLILRIPGRLTLEDVSRDGKALLTRDNVRVEMFARAAGGEREQELSWLDWSLVRDISEDGENVLFDESGEGGGENYAIYLRRLDGSPAVRLGEGAAMALSPDGAWALCRQKTSPSQLLLLPIRAGEPRTLTGPPLTHQRSAWFPDGRRIVFSASDASRRPRLYVQEIAGGEPRSISLEGMTTFWDAVAPDGKRVLARAPDGRIGMVPTEGGSFAAVSGLTSGETPIRWSADGRFLFAGSASKLPLVIRRVDLETGKGEKWKELAPADPAGVTTISSVRLTADGRGYAYSYRRVLSDLYLVEGLK